MSKKTCIITGSGRGIGKACAVHFAKNGYNVVVNYVHREPSALIEELEELNASYLAFQGDVSKSEDAKEMVQKAIEAFGQIDVLINNAGITKDGLLMRMKEEDFMSVLQVNLLGAFQMTKEVTPYMMKKRQGRIINISSVVGIHGNAGQSNYAASKAGLIGFTLSMAKELGKRNITCNAIAPGFIETEMTDVLSDKVKESLYERISLGHLGKTEDVANLAYFLAGEESAYITGQVIKVDGGMSL